MTCYSKLPQAYTQNPQIKCHIWPWPNFSRSFWSSKLKKGVIFQKSYKYFIYQVASCNNCQRKSNTCLLRNCNWIFAIFNNRFLKKLWKLGLSREGRKYFQVNYSWLNIAFRQFWCIIHPPQFVYGLSEYDIAFDLRHEDQGQIRWPSLCGLGSNWKFLIYFFLDMTKLLDFLEINKIVVKYSLENSCKITSKRVQRPRSYDRKCTFSIIHHATQVP